MTPRSRARPSSFPAQNPSGLLSTNEVAAFLGVHPKHIYRLLKRGLPARRVGDEWRYDKAEVLAWTRNEPTDERPAESRVEPPPLLAANGDLAVEALLETCRENAGPTLGFVLADHGTGLERLAQGTILGAGCHGQAPNFGHGDKFAWLQLAFRELGLAHRKGLRLRGISSILRHKLASRPVTAGIRRHLDQALLAEGIDLQRAYAHADEYASHRDAVMAVVRGNAEIALSSHAWAAHAGLGFTPLVSEAYGFVFRAEHLADPRVLHLCETAQSGRYRNRVAAFAGYETQNAGLLSIGSVMPGSSSTERGSS